MVVREVRARRVLSPSGIYDVDYSVNPYVGCEHACAYCFARGLCRVPEVRENWGNLVYVKVNAPRVLRRELRRARRGTVLVSSVTDPYQPVEARYQLTRRVLEALLRHGFPVVVMTKSDLVLRDADLLCEIGEVEVGLTITCDESASRVLEPRAPPPSRRVRALRELSGLGLETFAFIGPFIPVVTEAALEDMLVELRDAGVGRVVVDALSTRYLDVESFLSRLEPLLSPSELSQVEAILKSSKHYIAYYQRVRRLAGSLCSRLGLQVSFAY